MNNLGGPLSVVSCQLRTRRGRRARRMASRVGFTLIEVLVVILIILLVSAVALPTVLPAMAHRQMSEAARILQGALNGMRDSALHDGTPSGMRLLPDPAFPLVYLANGQIDPSQPLAASRIIPIETAPEYSEGMVGVVDTAAIVRQGGTLNVPYPAGNGGGFYPVANNSVSGGANVLMLKEIVVNSLGGLNEPTSWYWNIRVGDKLQVNGSGLWYTVVGPMINGLPQQGQLGAFCECGAARNAVVLF